MTTPAVVIPATLIGEVYRHARACYPEECCGWLAGPRSRPGLLTSAVACSNVARASARPAFAFADADLVAFTLGLAGERPARVIYHSHPGGTSELSRVDIDSALSPWATPLYPVQHLIIALDEHRIGGARLFAWSPSRSRYLAVAELAGAAI